MIKNNSLNYLQRGVLALQEGQLSVHDRIKVLRTISEIASQEAKRLVVASELEMVDSVEV
jgi:hypothetical protein